MFLKGLFISFHLFFSLLIDFYDLQIVSEVNGELVGKSWQVGKKNKKFSQPSTLAVS